MLDLKPTNVRDDLKSLVESYAASVLGPWPHKQQIRGPTCIDGRHKFEDFGSMSKAHAQCFSGKT